MDKNPARQNIVSGIYFLKVSLLYVARFITERIIVVIRLHVINHIILFRIKIMHGMRKVKSSFSAGSSLHSFCVQRDTTKAGYKKY